MAAERELQIALKSAIDALMPIASVGSVPVYDHVPQDTDPPFIRIGSDSASNSDTKTFNGMAHTVTIDIYSAYRGFSEIKLIMGAIKEALHNSRPTVTGYESTRLRWTFSTEFEEPEGTRGVVRFDVSTFN